MSDKPRTDLRDELFADFMAEILLEKKSKRSAIEKLPYSGADSISDSKTWCIGVPRDE